jgi:hypothetical protein
MKFKIDPQALEWWFWAVTLIAMISGFAGVPEGFIVVMLVSAIQVVYFWALHGFMAFPTQVRTVYGAFTVLAFFDPTRILYAALLVGTFMVTFFDRCIIARVLIHMPWNKDVKLS